MKLFKKIKKYYKIILPTVVITLIVATAGYLALGKLT